MARKKVTWSTDHHHPHAVRLLKEELPGQYPGNLIIDHGGLRPKEGEYFGLGVWNAKFVYDNLIGPAIANWGRLEYPTFRTRFASAVEKLKSMAGPDGKPSPEKASYIFLHSPNPRVSEKLADARRNMDHMKEWLEGANVNIGDFCLKPAIFMGPDAKFGHPEAPMSLDLYYKSHRLAGAGFLIYKKAGKIVMRITNVQGTDLEDMHPQFRIKYGARGMAKVFNSFESLVLHSRFGSISRGEKKNMRGTMQVAADWRSVLVSRLTNYAIGQGWQVEGRLPIRFGHLGDPAISDEEHMQKCESVGRAYEHAGFGRGADGIYRFRIPRFQSLQS